jgi:hypothetical protein
MSDERSTKIIVDATLSEGTSAQESQASEDSQALECSSTPENTAKPDRSTAIDCESVPENAARNSRPTAIDLESAPGNLTKELLDKFLAVAAEERRAAEERTSEIIVRFSKLITVMTCMTMVIVGMSVAVIINQSRSSRTAALPRPLEPTPVLVPPIPPLAPDKTTPALPPPPPPAAAETPTTGKGLPPFSPPPAEVRPQPSREAVATRPTVVDVKQLLARPSSEPKPAPRPVQRDIKLSEWPGEENRQPPARPVRRVAPRPAMVYPLDTPASEADMLASHRSVPAERW